MKTLLRLLMGICLLACISVGNASANNYYSQDLKLRLHQYRPYAWHHLFPYFNRAHVFYPPRKLALLIFKHSRHLEVWAKNKKQWIYIRSYPVLGASGYLGPKFRQGDHQVPEGVYRIVSLNPRSRFTLSMQINYPNAFDLLHANAEGRNYLGSNIFIHGDRRSTGCVAVGDSTIQQLFPLVYDVGLRNVTVIIAPNDLRYQRPLYSKIQSVWLPELYAKIKKALLPFKSKRKT